VLLLTTSDVVFDIVSDIIGRCLLVTALGHLPAHLCEAVCGHPVVGGVLDGDTVRLLERAPEEVALSTLSWVYSQ
jgi:hypothetical protein